MAPRTPMVLDVGANASLSSKTPIEAMIAIAEENITNNYTTNRLVPSEW